MWISSVWSIYIDITHSKSLSQPKNGVEGNFPVWGNFPIIYTAYKSFWVVTFPWLLRLSKTKSIKLGVADGMLMLDLLLSYMQGQSQFSPASGFWSYNFSFFQCSKDWRKSEHTTALISSICIRKYYLLWGNNSRHLLVWQHLHWCWSQHWDFYC